jgi:HlyD family secretion protein
MMAGTTTAAHASIRRHLWAGVAVVGFLAFGVGGWASTTEISGAVIATGSLVVDSNVKKVQHPTGGIVGEIRARDGDRVREGDILVRLDETVTRANMAIVRKGLNEFMARKARLEAERDEVEEITFPVELSESVGDAEITQLLASERKVFQLRKKARFGQKAQLVERIAQLREEIDGHAAQERGKSQEIVLIKRELGGARELWKKNLMPITKLTSLEREATRLEGERSQLVAAIAKANGKIAETQLQIIQIDRDVSSDVSKELREIEAKIGEFVERKVTTEDQLKRIDIRAPQDGTVHQSAVHTIGGVVTASDVIMLIVPLEDKLVVEVKVMPQDIDQLSLGQAAMLRFQAFNQRSTPEINGTISRISADITSDQRTGASYYTVRIATPPEEIARLGAVKLVPGMPVEAFIKTDDRTVISYLVKPLHDQITRAFREK